MAEAPRNIDEFMLRHADTHSPEQISKLLSGSISPAAVRLHIQKLLGAPDWLSAAQQDQLNLQRLRTTLRELEGQFLSEGNARVRLAFLKEIGGQLERRAKATETDLNVLYANQGRLMVQAFDIALSYIKGALREAIDPVEWDALVKEGLLHAQAELAKYQAVEA